MWSRVELKEKAKRVLSKTYWNAFLVSLVICLIGGDHNGGGGGNAGRGANNFSNGASSGTSYEEGMLLMIIGGIILTVFFVGLLVRIFLGYMLEVGGRKYFIQASYGENNMGYLGYIFKEKKYGNVLGTMFYRDVLIFLWTLLLIIPGIIKSYAYRMVPYILADNPNMNYKRAVELSQQMTRGHKFDIWVLDLSFIGWYLLGALALGVGVFFVKPYDNATNAELYLKLRENALKEGMCTYSEVGLKEDPFAPELV